ncbi:MAG: signal peptide peptidase SppA [Sedimentisphaerales bacterium]|nr:signal peptide peptidase SppA [Sedimentisphaerales bacterium]
MEQNDINSGQRASREPAESVAPPCPIPVYVHSTPPYAGRKAGSSLLMIILRYFLALIVIGSLFMNIYLGIIVARSMHQNIYQTGDPRNLIALIDLQGTITMKTADQIRLLLKRARENDSVKGVILVVNSPGGQVAPSNMINKYISDFKEDTGKKFYVSIQQMGASGAYWIAAAADKIYAQTNSVVGSIGVIYMNIVVEKALKEKLSVEPIIIKSTRSEFKDRSTPFRMPTEVEIQMITQEIDTIHERFVKIVSEGRGLTMDETWSLATGEVFDGPKARENKLVDEEGFLEDAIQDLARELDIEDPMIVRFVTPPTLKEMLTAGGKALENPLDIQKQLDKWAMTPRIQAIWMGQ